MKAVFFETAPWERRYLARALAKSKLRVRFLAEPLTDATRRLADGAAVLSVFIVITPHIAFDSTEALQRILDTTVTNIAGFLSGAPVNLV